MQNILRFPQNSKTYFLQMLCMIGFGIFANLEIQAQTYLKQDFETPFVGTTTLTTTTAPSGSATTIPANQNWTQTRFIMSGDGLPDGINTYGEQDWDRNVNTGVSTWSITPTDQGTVPTAAVSGTGVLWYNDANAGITSGYGMRSLQSPTIDLSTSTNPYVRFWFFYAGTPTKYGLRVIASKDNGVTWKSLMNLPGGFATATAAWQQINVIVPAEYRVANVKFGFEITNCFQTHNQFIDDFTVEEFTPTTITSATAGDWNSPATWTGGVVPNANNHVVISHAVNLHSFTLPIITTSIITRCQNLTIQNGGSLAYGTTNVQQLLQIMGNLTVDVGGNGNFLSGTTGKTIFVGGNVVNNGNLNFSTVSASATNEAGINWNGGSAATYSGTGTVGTVTNRHIPALTHNNESGVTYNAPLKVASSFNLFSGAVNPNGNITLGQNTTSASLTVRRSGAGYLTQAPIWGTLSGTNTFNVRYQTSIIDHQHTLSKKLIQTSHEVPFIGGTYQISGNLTMVTYDNLELAFPISVGAGLTSGASWAMTRGIIYSTPTNLLTINALTVTAMTNGADQNFSQGIVTNQGSYVVGTLKVNFGNTTGTRYFPMGLGGNFSTPQKNSNALKLITFTKSPVTAWTGQSVTVSLSGTPTGNVNLPLLALASNITYRIQDNGAGASLLPTTSVVTFGGINTTFGETTNNLQGDGADLRIAQSLLGTAGTWTNQSTAGGTAGAITNYVSYNVNIPVGGSYLPISTKGEFFTFASISPTCTGTPNPGNTITTTSTVCMRGNAKLSLQNTTAGTSVNYQWQSSIDGGLTFSNISNAIYSTYLATNITQNTQFRCLVTCVATGFSATSTPVTVNLPTAPTAPNVVGCGNPTTVTLTGTGTGGTLKWYDLAINGTLLFSGNPFTTPSISTATDYYVSEEKNSTSSGTGLATNAVGTFVANAAKGQTVLFSTLTSGTINSVAVYPFAAGTTTVQLYDGTGTNKIGAAVTATFTAAQVGTKVVVPLNIAIPRAGDYRLVNEVIAADITLGNMSLLALTTQYPFVSSDGLLMLTASATLPNNSISSTIYATFFDINFTGICTSPRTKVTASTTTLINAIPTINNIANVSIFASSPQQTVNLSGIGMGIGDAGQTITVTATSSNLALIPNPTITYTSPNATGTLKFTPITSQTGTSTITVTVTDNGGIVCGGVNTVTKTFVITVAVPIIPPPINKTQIINFDSIANRPFTLDLIALVAKASSGLPVSFEVTAGNAILVGNSFLSLTNIGLVTVRATQNGGNGFLAAEPVSRSFMVGQRPQTISGFTTIADRAWNTPNFNINANSSLALPITFTVTEGSNIAEIINGNTVRLKAAVGKVTITATQAGNVNTFAATPISQSFNVIKANQEIINTSNLPNLIFSANLNASLSAIASSSLPVTISVASGNATITTNSTNNTINNTINFFTAGNFVVNYTQAGNDLWNSASIVSRTYVVNKANQEIILSSLPTAMLIGASQTIAATTTSGLPITMRIISGTGTVNGLIVTPTAGNRIDLELSQAGNDNFNAANPITFSINITPTLTLSSVSGSRFCANATVTINFAVAGLFANNNRMIAYLSDENGNFTNNRGLIGTTDTQNSGTIIGAIPANAISGKNYKIRVEGIFPYIFSNSSATTIEINALPELAFIRQDGSDLVSSVANNIQWFANGVAIAGATAQKYKPTTQQIVANPSYTVVTSNGSCVLVSNSSNYSFIVTGIENSENNLFSAKISIFPNPTNDKFMVELALNKLEKVVIHLLDVSGKVILEESILPSSLNFKHELNMTNYASGVYVLMLVSEGKTAVKRVVKQ